MVAERIAQYELLEIVGVGAESNIYRARDTVTGRIVAVKDVFIKDPKKEQWLQHIRNEYEVVRELWAGVETSNGLPGLVRVYELITSGWLRRTKRCSLVMEYIEGKDLRREKRYPLGQMIDFFRQVAEALAIIHSKGVIHGDLKPENIIVGPQGEVTLVDFGFSCRSGSKATRIRGTRDYLAPEQAHKSVITERTDIYNFGATMYYLLSNSHVPALIPAADEKGFFIRGEKVRPRDIRELNSHLPEPLAQLVMECCEPEVSERRSSAERIGAVLRGISADFLNSS